MSAPITPQRHIRAGLIGTVLLLGTFGAWATFATLHGAVVTTGELVYTDGGTIDILHSDGGTVAAVLAQPGAAVKAGTTIAQIDGTLLAVERRILEDRLFEARLRDWRTQALLDGAQTFPNLPTDLQASLDARPELARSLAREQAAFTATLEQHTALLDSIADQQDESLRAAEAALAIAEGMGREIAVLTDDIARQTALRDKGLAQWNVLSSLERSKIQVENSRLQSQAEAAAQQARHATLALEAAQQTATYRAKLADTLAQTAEAVPELQERIVGIVAQQERLDIKAPTDGHINTLLLASPGVVAMPGTVVATLVPDAEAPRLVAPIAPQQIDQVWEGQTALLRPMTRAHNDLELHATVVRVSEGVLRNPTTGASYYEVVLDPHLDPLRARGDGLVSGTPFEVAIQTNARSPLAYLLEPVQRSFRRALRE